MASEPEQIRALAKVPRKPWQGVGDVEELPRNKSAYSRLTWIADGAPSTPRLSADLYRFEKSYDTDYLLFDTD